MKRCLFAGTFDPVTNGHYDTVLRLNEKYEEIVVAIGINHRKQPFFSLEDRLNFLRKAFENCSFVKVDYYTTLTVEYMKQENINVLVRGIRNEIDLEYEKKNEQLSKTIYPNLVTEYFVASANLKNLSSTLVRQLIKEGKDISSFVPNGVEELIKKSMNKQ